MMNSSTYSILQVGRSPRLPQAGADHKFIFVDIEVQSVLSLQDVIMKCNADALFKGSKDTAAKGKWKVAVGLFEQDIPALTIIAPITKAMADMMTFLSASNVPRLGYLRQRVQDLIATAETAVKAAEEPPSNKSAAFIAKSFLSEITTVYNKELLDHPMYVVAEALTPHAALRLKIVDTDEALERNLKPGKDAVLSALKQAALPATAAPANGDKPAPPKRMRSDASSAASPLEAEWVAYQSLLDNFGDAVDGVSTVDSMWRRMQAHDRTDLGFWHAVYQQLPRLSAFARSRLHVQPTQTASERVFSRMRDVTEGRQRLTNERLEQFVLSAANFRIVNQWANESVQPEFPDDGEAEDAWMEESWLEQLAREVEAPAAEAAGAADGAHYW